MNTYISPLERIILESIQRKNNTQNEISADTNIQNGILQNVIHSLLVKGLIVMSEEKFVINTNLSQEILTSLKNKENIILECNEIVRASIKISIKNEVEKSFRLKKTALNDSQKKIFKAMLFNLDSFLEDCNEENKNMKTKDQTVIFWGANSYEDLIQNILNSI